MQLDLTSAFYAGKEESEEKIRIFIKVATMMHFIGKKSVALAIKEKAIEKGNVRKVKSIPHAQCLRM